MQERLTKPLRVRLYPRQAAKLATIALRTDMNASEAVRFMIEHVEIEEGYHAANLEKLVIQNCGETRNASEKR